SHLLNVPAGNMSAFPSDPNHFLGWLDSHSPQTGNRFYGPGSFVPRRLYGDYLNAILNSAAESVPSHWFQRITAQATDLSVNAARVKIKLASGATVEADRAVLSFGNFPPLPLFDGASRLAASGRYIPDPWQPGALDSIAPDATVVLIGTGLTMVDTAIALIHKGHRGPLHAISRHGLQPRRHPTPPPVTPIPPFTLAELPLKARGLLRTVRRRIRYESVSGWQPVIDALRPVTQELWRRAPQAERARFLRHLQALWDVHRHRLPPEVAVQIDRAVAAGRLRFRSGRVVACDLANDCLNVRIHPRGSSGLTTNSAQYLINCTGPASDYRRIGDPLVRSLLARGLVRPDPLRLGLDVDHDLHLIGSDGTPSPRLYAAGPVTKGAAWEITAVPDLRMQAETLARHLAAVTHAYSGDEAAASFSS
ncbi:MAG: FAD/NAD(P)-binding protein, partial [Gammaproteobacteria bacterium]